MPILANITELPDGFKVENFTASGALVNDKVYLRALDIDASNSPKLALMDPQNRLPVLLPTSFLQITINGVPGPLVYDDFILALVGIIGASSGGGGGGDFATITGSPYDNIALGLALDAKQGVVPEDAGISYVNQRVGVIDPVNPSIVETFSSFDEAVAESPYNTTGAIIEIQGGCAITPSPISLNIGTLGLAIVGAVDAHSVIKDWVIDSSSGTIIFRNCTVENLACNINIIFENCIVKGTFTSTTNDQTIKIYNSDYTGITNYSFLVTAGKKGTIDIGTSSHGDNLEIGDLVVLTREVSSYSPTPPLSPTLNRRYLIGLSGTGEWFGKDYQIATWNGSVYTFEFPTNNSYVYNTGDSTYYYYSAGMITASYPSAFFWIIDGKLADTGVEGLMSKAYHAEVSYVNTQTVASDTNIDNVNIEGGNLIVIPTEIIGGVAYDRLWRISDNEVNTVVFANFRNIIVEMPILFPLTGEEKKLADGKVFTIAHGAISGNNKPMLIRGYLDNARTIPTTFRIATGSVSTNLNINEGSSTSLRCSFTRSRFEENQ